MGKKFVLGGNTRTAKLATVGPTCGVRTSRPAWFLLDGDAPPAVFNTYSTGDGQADAPSAAPRFGGRR